VDLAELLIKLEWSGGDSGSRSSFGTSAYGGSVLAHQGDLDRALALSREAVALAESTDALNVKGAAFMDLAEVLRLSGRGGEAIRLWSERSLCSTRRGTSCRPSARVGR
jgi:hypothetical protein